MAKRERLVTPVTCPECALNGSATWEESERGNLETTIKTISDGFRSTLKGSFIAPSAELKLSGADL